MLAKLVKYEFLATSRLIFPAYIGALLFGLILRPATSNAAFDGFFLNASTFFFVVSIFAVVILTFVIIVRRFSSSMFKDEGYLTHTLPVSVDALIWAKLIAAIGWTLLGIVIISFSTWFVTSGLWWNTLSLPHYVWQEIEHGLPYGLAGLLMFFSGLLFLPVGILSLYCALSIGQMVKRFKVLLAIVVFFSASFVLSFVTEELNFAIRHQSDLLIAGVVFLYYLLQGTLFYFATRWVLRRRLNLE
ncbi:MAG: hypothetical protein FWD84_01050 [Oscillospiraceae bacterium]|nr:hypothetical protein [Oscillospiraceae bacterium]